MSICSKCKKEFKCCANTDEPCWCNDLFIPIENLKKLKATYDACLCPDCLKEYSQEKK